MKYSLVNNVQIEFFSDGECVVYDGNNEMIHVLNLTASIILKALLEKGESALQVFLENAKEYNWEINQSVLENDYQNTVNSLRKLSIIDIR